MLAAPDHRPLPPRRTTLVVGLALIAATAVSGCSHRAEPVGLDDAFPDWAKGVQDRWAGQPGELGSGTGSNDSSSRLSLGTGEDGAPARVRVSITCQGDGTVHMAVWAGRIVDGAESGKRLASGEIRCGHDEDLYLRTRSEYVTIGPTSGDSTVGWYAATYSDLAATAAD
ncbi:MULTISPECIES: hypothetical protein [unclassified Curtobacterium]|uniref:hypothetical protein n=1 Tax=unclassified Curtobacterium TaxID=257496 RepID=UPI0039B0E890